MQITLDPCPDVRTTPVGERLLEAAGRLFSTNGINATGVDRIVDEAATTKRTLYQRFGSKDALVADWLQRRAHLWQRELLSALDEQGDPASALDVVYEHALSWARSGRRGCAFVNAWAEIGTWDHPGVAVIRSEKAWMRQLFTQVAARDAQVGLLLHLLYEGAQVAAAIGDDLAALEAARTASLEALSRLAGRSS